MGSCFLSALLWLWRKLLSGTNRRNRHHNHPLHADNFESPVLEILTDSVHRLGRRNGFPGIIHGADPARIFIVKHKRIINLLKEPGLRFVFLHNPSSNHAGLNMPTRG